MNLEKLGIQTGYDHEKDIVLMNVADLPKILEKLIADIPDYEICLQADSEHLTEEVDLRVVKQQLRDKWL